MTFLSYQLELRDALFARHPPESVFSASGAYGQYVLLVPTHDLIVVRLGHMHAVQWPDLGARLAEIVAAFPALAPETR